MRGYPDKYNILLLKIIFENLVSNPNKFIADLILIEDHYVFAGFLHIIPPVKRSFTKMCLRTYSFRRPLSSEEALIQEADSVLSKPVRHQSNSVSNRLRSGC